MGRFLAPEIVKKCNFLAPEIFIMTQLFFWPQKSSKWDNFWLQKSSKNDDFWPQKSSLWLNFISGPRNRQDGTISGPRNRQSDQEILYGQIYTALDKKTYTDPIWLSLLIHYTSADPEVCPTKIIVQICLEMLGLLNV